MTTLGFSMSKIREMFKNLKSDAMPRAPRPSNDVNNATEQPQVHVEDIEDEEEVIIAPEGSKKNPKKKVYRPKKKFDNDDHEEIIGPNKKEQDGSSSVNVQATGNVYNIVNSSKVRVGNDYYFGPVSMTSKRTNNNSEDLEEDIEKDNLITLLMEAQVKPDRDYLDYISKNLGKNYNSLFRSMGFKQGRIDTAKIDAGAYGISEARYKLLLEWVNNDEDGTLGRLATYLWEEGERGIVKELSAMYMKSKTKKKY